MSNRKHTNSGAKKHHRKLNKLDYLSIVISILILGSIAVSIILLIGK